MFLHRFNALKEVVMPYKEKEDQAAFLKSAAEYIRHLQVCLALLLDSMG
jgi:hypothetical protein